jgi:hypothetical protein
MATNEKMSAERLAQKIRWEGGLMAALEYGIRPEDIADKDLADLWTQLRNGYRQLSPLLAEASARLKVAA